MSILPYGFVKNIALRLNHIPFFTCCSSVRKLCATGTVTGFGCTKVNKEGSMQLPWGSSPGEREKWEPVITNVPSAKEKDRASHQCGTLPGRSVAGRGREASPRKSCCGSA